MTGMARLETGAASETVAVTPCSFKCRAVSSSSILR